VSLVSRSPSPKPQLDSTMQKVYNEHMRGIDQEIVTLETKIRDTNIGYAMLQKLGWKDGEGLGARGQGKRTNNDLNEKMPIDHFHLQAVLIPSPSK
jgi:hypothetical protein